MSPRLLSRLYDRIGICKEEQFQLSQRISTILDLIVTGKKIASPNTKSRVSAAVAYLKSNIRQYESPDKVLEKILQSKHGLRTLVAEHLAKRVAEEHARSVGLGEHGAEDIGKLVERLKGTKWSYNATSHMLDLHNKDDKIVLSVPFGMFLPLYEHQMDGIQRIFFNFNSALGGMILGDEMGLGKTRQALIAIFSLMLKKQVQRVLILCPPALISTWMAEAKKLTTHSVALDRGIDVVEFSSKKAGGERNQTLRKTREKGRLLLVIASSSLIPTQNQTTESYNKNPLFPIGKMDREFSVRLGGR
eukprot:scaffold6061_cov156-Amphora_coffeaeformis.AAC.6